MSGRHVVISTDHKETSGLSTAALACSETKNYRQNRIMAIVGLLTQRSTVGPEARSLNSDINGFVSRHVARWFFNRDLYFYQEHDARGRITPSCAMEDGEMANAGDG